MKILFAGTPKTSSIILKNLIDLGHDVIGVITQPDKKRGRRAIESPSPVSEIARSNDIKQYKPTNLNDLEFKNTISNNEFDVLIVVAYGKILPKWLLDLPNIMPVNIHFSLLPKYRGASPIQSSLLNGETETGITFIKMTEGLDSGEIIHKDIIKIKKNHNKLSLEDDLVNLAIINIDKLFSKLSDKKLTLIKQKDELATYCSKINKEDSFINFNMRSIEIYNIFKAFIEWPLTKFIHNNIEIIIRDMYVSDDISNAKPGTILDFSKDGLSIKTIDSAIVITHLQFPGKRIIGPKDVYNSYKSFFLNN